ncbi:MAG TPA: cytochrome c biogenesis protein ResB [Actinomycetota bacterium]|nr:cytochrome c biogenesis protein ResB [Actinomycetota bacterium]
MSSVPQPRGITMRRSLALVWRTLRSMRTALVLLLLLALASIAGSLVPQAANSPEAVAAMARDHPLRAELYARLGLFDVYGSWWFTLIYTLLLLSLAACLLPRTRALVRNLRTRPQPAREVDGFRHHAAVPVGASPAEAVAAARRLLRRRRFRLSAPDGGAALAADKGLAREAGSLLFHWSFFLLLVGVAWGKGTGFTGFAVIVEGQAWTEAHANYDGNLREGTFFGEDHTGIRIRVRDFEDRYLPDGQPTDFVTRADLLSPDGTLLERVDIRVNQPAEVGGLRVYQYGYGWAPVLEVRRDGQLLAQAPIPFQQDPPPRGVSPLSLPWRGALKLPSLSPQLGVELDLWPDARGLVGLLAGRPIPMTEARDPVLLFRVYRGDLHAERVQRSADLDTRDMRQIAAGALGLGRTVDLETGEEVEPDAPGLTMTFAGLRRYTVLQVSRDRGLGLVLGAAILMLVGLLPALFSSRRRLFLRADPAPGGAVVRVGGFALQHADRFEEEFRRLVEELGRAGGPIRESAGVGAG